MLLLQVISYTEVTHLQDQEGEGSEHDSIAEKTNSSQNSAGVQPLDKIVHKHDLMDVDNSIGHAKPLAVDVDSSLAVRSQLSSEHMFSKLEGTESTPLLRKGSSIDEMDVSTVSNCDVPVSGYDSGRTDEEDQNYERTSGCVQDGADRDFKSPNGLSNISLENDAESRNSTITRNLPYSVVMEGNTSTDQLLNVNVSCRTGDMSQADFNVSDSYDTGRCFSRELSGVPEDVCEAGASMKDDVDNPEKTDDMEHSDDSDKAKNRKKALTSLKFMSYDEAHKKCGLILCNFPTVSNLVFIVFNNDNRGCWCDIIVLNVYAPTKDKIRI
jgi:hypothetical protein